MNCILVGKYLSQHNAPLEKISVVLKIANNEVEGSPDGNGDLVLQILTQGVAKIDGNVEIRLGGGLISQTFNVSFTSNSKFITT